jgi:hypothetical protein
MKLDKIKIMDTRNQYYIFSIGWDSSSPLTDIYLCNDITTVFSTTIPSRMVDVLVRKSDIWFHLSLNLEYQVSLSLIHIQKFLQYLQIKMCID